jgi:hypothetical protein
MDSAPSQFVIPANGIATDSNGGRTPAVSTSDGGRLTGAEPQPRQETKLPLLRCSACGSDDIQATAWIHANTGEVINDDGPTDQLWCPDCESDCSTIEDCGLGFELWREGEWSGHFATFAEALAEAKQSARPYEIDGAHTDVEAA